MPRPESIAEVAVAGPLRRTFIYRVPESIGELQPGQRLLVPFGRGRKTGYYLGPAPRRPGLKLKDITRAIDAFSYFSPELFKFCRWMADYYFANPADCLVAALPPPLKSGAVAAYFWKTKPDWLPPSLARRAGRGKRVTPAVLSRITGESGLFQRLVDEAAIVEQPLPESSLQSMRYVALRAAGFEVWEKHFATRKFQPGKFDGSKTRVELKEAGWSDYQIRLALRENILLPVYRDEEHGSVLEFVQAREDVSGIVLNAEQQAVVEELHKSLGGPFSPTLLHGVTGSGKTIVYCHLCRDLLQKGKTALVLTPEIALTGSILSYFRGFFGDLVTVIHSAMTDRERWASWRDIRSGRCKIVVGPRSAIFAPLPDLGLIVVDEEHDQSYKQSDPAPRFHGRDAAVMRAKLNDIPILLGTASPSLESYHHARSGRYRLLRLTRRPAGAGLPTVHVVDMRKDRLRGDLSFMSFPLKQEMENRLANGEQAILYLNRRGHSPQLKCCTCGEVPQCPHCRINMTYHKVGHKLSCHYCGFVRTSYDVCPKCRGTEFIYLGVGTQKVEESLSRLFKDARAVRLDSDSASGRKRAHAILSEFASRKSNVLLGTQMVTKGLDFPGVTLVGVLSADMSLDLPDFRASEKTFARLLQVSGRSGRSQSPGEVKVQTYYPGSDLIADAARQDYEAFFDREIESRRALSFPPFSRLVNFTLSGSDEKKLEKTALEFSARLRDKISRSGLKAELLGPAPRPLYLLRGKYRRHMFVKTRQVVKLVGMLTEWETAEPRFKLPSAIKLVVDVDPDDMM